MYVCDLQSSNFIDYVVDETLLIVPTFIGTLYVTNEILNTSLKSFLLDFSSLLI